MAIAQGWERRSYALTPGVHVVDADSVFTALVYGKIGTTSYLYLAGMAL